MCSFAAYIHLYGLDAQLHLARRISALEAQHSEMLSRLPEDFQRKFHTRRKQAAAEAGAEDSTLTSTPRWPSPIAS